MTLVHAIRWPRLRRAVIVCLAAPAIVVAGAAPAAALAADRAEPWVAVVEGGGAIRIDRVEAPIRSWPGPRPDEH